MSNKKTPPKTKRRKATPHAGPGVQAAAKSGQRDSAVGGRYPVVGIGASAGGLAALKRLFEHMPPDTGMAFVVILHLDPDHESHMSELLAKATDMEVMTAAEGMAAAPDRVYVIPQGKTLTLREGVLHLGDSRPRATRFPIDEFFHSLARDQKEKAIAVVLTGTGSDGARGIREVKAEGGMLVAQDPERSEYDSMPRSAIATGLVDRIAALEDIPRVIRDYAEHARLDAQAIADNDDQEADFGAILTLLKARGNFDFSWYKRSTVERRVRRRMGLTRNATLKAYLKYLRSEQGEAALLVNDLLIGVTAFFREPEAWDYLQEVVLSRLVEEGEAERPIRVWVPGCSTGEEVYTLAMLLTEELERRRSTRRIQLFATDVDESALEVARAGLYSERAVAPVRPERLKRFFVREQACYRVAKELRECVIFAQQNLIADSPFSRLDLISCRNLLIYLESAQQGRVFGIFHFVLRDNGFLFLGSSETVGKRQAMFATVSKKWRVYRRVGATRRPPLDLTSASGNVAADWRRPAARQTLQRSVSAHELACRMLLDHCVPAAVLVDRNAEVLYFHGDTERYLIQPQGEPTTNLLDLARRGLRGRLRAAIHRAHLKRERVLLNEVSIQRSGEQVPIQVVVIPWAGEGAPESPPLALVTFEDAPQRLSSGTEPPEHDDTAALAQLEDELKRTKEELQSTIEELETANEELKVSNEESMSMNEELQSTNEELETSKEELQSLNEELTTINSQLEEKVGELQETTDDLENLLVSSNIATVFLDRQLRIKRFTPAVTNLMSLVESDVGRDFRDISSRVDAVYLLEDAARVLDELQPMERELHTESSWYLRRIQPYRTQTHRIEGVVVTYIDITDSKRRADEHARLAAVVSASDDAILTKDFDGTILSWNRAAEVMYGYTEKEVLGRNIAMMVPNERMEELRQYMETARRGEQVRRVDTVRIAKDGRRIEVALSISPVYGDDGKIHFFSSTHRDVTEISEHQREVQRLNRDLQRRVSELQTLIDVAPVGISIAHDPECRVITTNAAGGEMLGASSGDNVSLSADATIKSPYRVVRDRRPVAPEDLPLQRAARDGTSLRNQDLQLIFDDGRKLEILMNAEPLLEENGRPRGAVGVFMNITERKRIEARLRRQAEQLIEADRRKDDFLAVLGHELRNPLAPIRNIVDLLRTKPNQDRKALAKAMDMVGRQVEQLSRLVDDLLDVARISHDDIQLKCESVDLVGLCNQVVEDSKPLFKQHAQNLRYVGPGSGLMLHADPVRIAQIVSNLLHNASNYTPEGGNVELVLGADDRFAVVKVRDDGVGIPTEDQQAIFDPFSHTASRVAHHGKAGLGLGLTLSQRLVQMHGGDIAVYSEGPGHGSEFTVRLPLAVEGQAAAAKSQTAPARRSLPKRIMLVEDNADVSDALSTLLTALGHEVRTAHIGAEALKCAAEFQPQIAFIDIGLPDMDGYEVARQLRSRDAEDTLLVALSGYGRTDSGEPDIAPFDEYLLKPLSFERIGEILSRVT